MGGFFYDVDEGFCVGGEKLVLTGSEVLKFVGRRAIEVFIHVLTKDLAGLGDLLLSLLLPRRLVLELLISHTLVVLL